MIYIVESCCLIKYCNVEYKMVTGLVICFLREKKHITAGPQRRKHQNSVELGL